jgi:polar amino acid transport system substrate-binding protein
MSQTENALAILLVEDNPRHSELIRDELEVEIPNAHVKIAEDVAKARDLLAKGTFQTVILDFQLPDGDGLELLRELKQGNRPEPVVFVTTSTSAEIAVEAMKIGAEDYLIKEEGYVSILPFVVREVLDRVRLRTERVSLEQRLERAERLASLHTLMAGMAHNINNPLTTVRTFLELLPTRYASDAEFRTSYYELVLNEVQRIKELIGSMMQAVAIPADVSDTPWQAAELISEIEAHLHGSLKQKGIHLERQIPADLPALRVSREAIKQAMIILIDNAIAFSPEGARVALKAHREERTARPHVVIEVVDEGPGVPPDQRKKIFDPFYTTRPGGIGMGLFVAHCVARAQGGSIDVGSRLPRGATFALSLPAA